MRAPDTTCPEVWRWEECDQDRQVRKCGERGQLHACGGVRCAVKAGVGRMCGGMRWAATLGMGRMCGGMRWAATLGTGGCVAG
eukprot:127931-Chlamydomonas_euryale.AAC.1